MTIKTSRKKLKASLALFIIALVVLAVAVLAVLFGDKLDLGNVANIIFGICLMVYIVLMVISIILNWSYRHNSIVAGASSTALYVLQFIFLLPVVILLVCLFVYALMHGMVLGGGNLRKIKVKDEDGREYVLTQISSGSNRYEDQYGDLWETFDDGLTFERVIKKAKADDGQEFNLNPTYDGIVTKYYEDENGNEWQSLDGGKTFDKK